MAFVCPNIECTTYNAKNGSGMTTTVSSSNSLTSDTTFVLPPNTGSNNYVLKTDGTGNTIWADPNSLGIIGNTGETGPTGPILSNAFMFTYQPGFTGPTGPTGSNVYANWNDLYTAFQNTYGEKWITFDTSTSPTPGTVTIPAGTYDLRNAVFYYPLGGIIPSIPIVNIDIDDGVVFSNLAAIDGPMLLRYNGTSAPLMTINNFYLLSMTNSAMIKATQSKPFVDVVSGGMFILSLGYGSSVGTNSTFPTINADGQLQINITESGAVIGDTNVSNTNAISGTGFFQIVTNNQSFSIVPLTASRYPLFTGTFNYTNGSNTARMVLSNGAAGPSVNDDISVINPVGTIWTSLNPANQNTYVSVNDTTGAAVWKQFAYVPSASTAGTAVLGPGGTITINTTSVSASSIILATFAFGVPSGTLYINNINPGVSFDIISTNPADAGINVFWHIVV